MRLAIGILAAGRGNRLNAGRPKGWALLRGQPLCYHVLDVAHQLLPDRIIVSCPPGWEEDLPFWKGLRAERGGKGYLPDLFSLIHSAKGADLLIIVNADAVLVTAESLRELIKVAEENEADFVWPGVPEEVCYPEESRRYVPGGKRLRRSNVLAVRPSSIHVCWGLKALLYLLLTKWFRWLGKIGEPILAIPIMGIVGIVKCLRLTLAQEELARRIGRFLRCKAVIPEMRRDDLAFDVDYPQDLEVADGILESRPH